MNNLIGEKDLFVVFRDILINIAVKKPRYQNWNVYKYDIINVTCLIFIRWVYCHRKTYTYKYMWLHLRTFSLLLGGIILLHYYTVLSVLTAIFLLSDVWRTGSRLAVWRVLTLWGVRYHGLPFTYLKYPLAPQYL